MPPTAFVALAAMLFENNYFLIPLILKDFCFYNSTFEEGGAKFGILAINDGQDIFNFYRGACLGIGITVQLKNIALLDGKLGSLGLYGRFHEKKDLKNRIWGKLQE